MKWTSRLAGLRSRGLPFDKLQALSKAEELKVHPEARFVHHLKRMGLRAVERARLLSFEM